MLLPIIYKKMLFFDVFHLDSQGFICTFTPKRMSFMEKEMINRLKIVLAEEQKSSKWLAEQLGKDRATVSKWVTNTMQPDARNLLRIAEALNIDAGRLLNQKHLKK